MINRRRWTTYLLAEGASSLHNEDSSIHSDGNSIHNDGNSIHSEELLGIARPIRESSHARTESIKAAVLALCRVRFLSSTELASLLNRNPVSLRNRILIPLVVDGLLELKYSDRNHPQQAYRTKPTEVQP